MALIEMADSDDPFNADPFYAVPDNQPLDFPTSPGGWGNARSSKGSFYDAPPIIDFSHSTSNIVDGSGGSADGCQPINDSNHHDHGHDHPKTNLLSTFFNFIKTAVGTGILALPGAIKNAGLIVGTAGVLLLGLFSMYCCHQLLHVYDRLGVDGTVSFSQLAYLVFYKAGPRARRLASFAKHTVNVFLLITQIGILCVYILFVSRMVKEVVDVVAPSVNLDIREYQAITLALLIPYCFVKTLQVLSYFALAANVATVVGLGIVLQYALRNLQPVVDLDLYPPSISTMPLFFGTAMFSFECIAFILPMENRMADRDAFRHWNGLFTLAMTVVTAAYAFVGFYGYLAFGEEAQVILSNMPSGDWLYMSVKLVYAAAIFISYNLQLYVVVTVCYPGIKQSVNRPWFDRFGEYLFRTAVILFTFGLSVSIPCLELMISLFGAIGGGSLAVIFPPVIEFVSCSFGDMKHPGWTRLKCVILCILGTIGCVVGAVVTVTQIVDALGPGGSC